MTTIATVREFKRCNFTVRVQAVEDFDLDLSWDEDGEVRRQLERGDLCSFGAIATVYLHGERVGEDSLWGCIYKSPDDFMDHVGLASRSRKDGRNYGSGFTDLVHAAILSAREFITQAQAVKIRA